MTQQCMSPETYARKVINGEYLSPCVPVRWGRKTWAEQVAKELERLGWTVHRITIGGPSGGPQA